MNVEMVGVWLGADMDLDMELIKTTNKYSWLWTSSMANQYFTPLPHMSSFFSPSSSCDVTMLVIFLNSHCSTSDTQGMDTPRSLSLHHHPAGRKRASVREPAGDRGVIGSGMIFFLFFRLLIDHFFFSLFPLRSPGSSQGS